MENRTRLGMGKKLTLVKFFKKDMSVNYDSVAMWERILFKAM